MGGNVPANCSILAHSGVWLFNGNFCRVAFARNLDRTGIAAAGFSRIRNEDLGRFTVDRLMSTLNRLGSRVEVKVRVRRAEPVGHEVMA